MNKNCWVMLSLLALASACDLPDPLEVFEPTSNCLGPFYAPPGVKLNSGAIHNNEAILKHLFEHKWIDDKGIEHSKLMGSDKEFCMAFGGIHITFTGTPTITCGGGPSDNWGCNNEHGITLADRGQALVHELLHTWDLEHLIFETSVHPKWEKKGYYGLDDIYEIEQDRTIYPYPNATNTGYAYIN